MSPLTPGEDYRGWNGWKFQGGGVLLLFAGGKSFSLFSFGKSVDYILQMDIVEVGSTYTHK